jgi:hypothetical protein
MTDSLVASPRMQHLDARYHWLREQVVHDKTLRLVYCNTLDQIADSRSRSPDQLLPASTVLCLVALPLGTLLLEAIMVALDKVCFTLRSSRFCLIFRRTAALSPLTAIDRWGSDPGTAGQRHYPELGTRSPLVVVWY